MRETLWTVAAVALLLGLFACGPLCKIAPSLCSTGRLDVALVETP